MINVLQELVKLGSSVLSLNNAISVVKAVASLVEIFESQYSQDKDAKNAAIDAVIAILQQQKHK